MPIFVYDRRALQEMSRDQLLAKCARLTADWNDRGRPTEEKMPMWMLGAKEALALELRRRGEQLRLF